jgi:UDP-N-acetylglucosamine transferase subunit ALG13
MAEILVTVGMGRWPFDRLVAGIAPLCAEHRVTAQIGTSTLRPPCPSLPFMSSVELARRIDSADVVITHAGNTVRLVQRAGKVPIAVARQAAHGEMGNDHQVGYLRMEERAGPVVAVWDLADLARAVAGHPAAQERLLRERPLPPPADAERVGAILDGLCERLAR